MPVCQFCNWSTCGGWDIWRIFLFAVSFVHLGSGLAQLVTSLVVLVKLINTGPG